MKNQKIIYWVLTVLFAGFMAFSGFGGVKPSEQSIKFLHDGMGYPIHFIQFISIAKLVGAAALLLPIPKWLKEWAYAGMFFDLLGAFWALTVTSGSAAGGLFIVLPLVVGGLSYYFWKRTQA